MASTGPAGWPREWPWGGFWQGGSAGGSPNLGTLVDEARFLADRWGGPAPGGHRNAPLRHQPPQRRARSLRGDAHSSAGCSATMHFGRLARVDWKGRGPGTGGFLLTERTRGVMLQWLHQGASAWPLNFSVFTAAELEVPDTLGARYFFSFWSVLIVLWLNGLFILTECHPAWL